MWSELLGSGAAVAAGMALLGWEVEPRMSPDGRYYLAPDPPRPYGARLLARVLPQSFACWWAVSWTAVALTALGVGMAGGWVAAVLWLGLAQTRTNLLFPVLTDQVGQLCLVGALWLPWPWNLVAAVLGGCVNEKAPLFGAVLTGQWWMLAGMVPWGVGAWWSRAPDGRDPLWLQAPWKEARKVWQPQAQALLLPWGVAAAGLGGISLWALLLAYGQLAMAQDRARLYQWVGAPVAVAAAGVLVSWVPPEGVVPLLLLHWSNPWRRVL